MKKYYLHDGTEQTGPFSIEELKNQVFNENTSVWHKGLANWLKAKDLHELSDFFCETPPPFLAESQIENTSVNVSFTEVEPPIEPEVTDSKLDIENFKAWLHVCKISNGKKKYGYIKRNGEQALDFVLETPHFGFNDVGLSIGGNNNKFGVIDYKGKWLIQASFSDIRLPKSYDELICAKEEERGKWGLLKPNGTWLKQPFADDVMYLGTDNSWMCVNKKWGLLDRFGEWNINPRYEDLVHFDEKGMALMGNKSFLSVFEKYGFIDRRGNWVINPVFLGACAFGKFDHTFAIKGFDRLWGIIDRQGNWVCNPRFPQVKPFNTINTSAKDERTGKWGLIDRFGVFIKQPIFDEIFDFNDKGIAVAFIGDFFGLINETGEWVVEPNFKMADFYSISRDFSDGFDANGFLAVLSANGKYGLINKSGNWIIKPEFGSLGKLDEEGLMYASNGEKSGFIDLTNRWVIPPDKFDHIAGGFDKYGLCRVIIKEKWGFINREGNFIIEPKYDLADEFDQWGMAKVSINNKKGWIDNQGNMIINPVYELDELDEFEM
jgi:hypothetical protein